MSNNHQNNLINTLHILSSSKNSVELIKPKSLREFLKYILKIIRDTFEYGNHIEYDEEQNFLWIKKLKITNINFYNRSNYFSKVIFEDCEIENGDLYNVKLSDCEFSGNLQKCIFEGGEFKKGDIKECNFENATFLEGGFDGNSYWREGYYMPNEFNGYIWANTFSTYVYSEVNPEEFYQLEDEAMDASSLEDFATGMDDPENYREDDY